MEGDLAALAEACCRIGTDFSDADLAAFVQAVEKIPLFLANSTARFHEKLVAVVDAGLFSAIKGVLRNPLDLPVQLRFLKLWDFLVLTASSAENLTVLFAEQVTNTMVLYPFDFSSTEILQGYMAVLKGISMRVRDFDADLLFTADTHDCPLYSHSVPFIVNRDSIVVSAASLVVLNCCLVKAPRLQNFITDKVLRAPLVYLMDHMGTDELEFLRDFLKVAPLELTDFILKHLRDRLLKGDIVLLAQAAVCLCNGAARSTIMEVVSERIHSFPIISPLALGLVLHALEQKLILLDWAVRHGLTPMPRVPRCAPSGPAIATEGFIAEITELLQMHRSVPLVALPLRILERLSPELPSAVGLVKQSIVGILRECPVAAIMENITKRPEQWMRCDIDYLLGVQEDAPRSQQPDQTRQAILQLSEVEAAIGRWRGQRFLWFDVREVEDESPEQTFTLANQESVVISACTLVYERDSFSLARAVVARDRRNVTFRVLEAHSKRSRASMVMDKMPIEERRFEFASSATATTFAQAIERVQRRIIDAMLDRLLE
jgi:hypothetical protein